MQKYIWVVIIVVICFVAALIISIVARNRKIRVGGGECDECDYDGGGTFRLSIRDPWYTAMLKGEKTIEARIDKHPFDKLKVGDPAIVIHSRPQGSNEQYTAGDYKYKTTITKITKYNDFAELVKAVGVPALYPGKKTAIEAASIFSEFSPSEAQAGHAILAIEFAKPPPGTKVPK